MSKKLVLLMALIIVLLIGILGVAFKVQRVKASGTIYIRADGSIDPPAPISTVDNVTYTFTDNIYDEIMVERNNIIIDGSGHVLQGSGWGKGFNICNISNVTIKNSNIKGFSYGVYFNSTSINSIFGNNISNNNYGIWLEFSFNNILSRNNITNNDWRGIGLYQSFNNVLSENNISNNKYQGVQLYLSSNTTLFRNVMNGNKYNVDVWGPELGHYMHSIDVSNLVDGKPVYYLLNQKNLLINSSTYQIGYFALINCTDITVSDLTLTNNGQGLLFAYTNNSKIIGNMMTGNDFGIWLESSFNNTLFENDIVSNDYGVWLAFSPDNTLTGNTITNNRYGVWIRSSYNNTLFENDIASNKYGVWLDSSFCNFLIGNSMTNNLYGAWFCASSNNVLSRNNVMKNVCGFQLGLESSYNNTFSENNIVNNKDGIWLLYSSDNKFYHNNVLNNTVQAYNYPSDWSNVWDDGYLLGGNYWSNYAGVDSDYDGIGDTPHVIEGINKDNRPLMGMFYSFDISVGCQVSVISNSTIESFQYFESNATIRMLVSNMTMDQTCGFCRILIPHDPLPPPYNITINNNPVPYNIVYENDTLSILYFSYKHSILEIIITIPESPSFLILLLLMVATFLAVVIYRKLA
jgi:parallel beta-helix repeat protein